MSQKPATITTVTECGSLDRLKKHLNWVSGLTNVSTISLTESSVNRGMSAKVKLVHTYEKFHSEAEEALEALIGKETLEPGNVALEETIMTLHFPVTVTHTVVTSGHADPITLRIKSL